MLRQTLTALAGIILVLGTAMSVPTSVAATTGPYDPFFAAPTTVADFGAGTRPFGIAAGDFTGDGRADIVEGRVSGGAAAFTFQRQNADGTFATPSAFAWRVQTHNQWTIKAGDVNGDGKLDVVWGSSATVASSGCTVSPIPTGLTCAEAGGQVVTVTPGDVRVLYGNGDGSFQENTYFVNGVRFAGGQLLGSAGTAVGSIAIADIDHDLDNDIVAGGVDGTTSVVKILRNEGGGTFTMVPLISQPTAVSGDAASPTYYPATVMNTSPWGLAFGDADGDSDLDLFVADRAQYVYLYRNDGAGAFSLKSDNTRIATRPNVYLAWSSSPPVGYTASLAAGDVTGDGRADLAIGLFSGGQGSAANATDGAILLATSTPTGHMLAGQLADIGFVTRGVTFSDVNGDGAQDIVAGEYGGTVKLLRQLPPVDTDGDGISDYVDNAPAIANAPRLDMNGDGSINRLDQLDNDFDTVLGNPEDQATWQRLGDPADPDDDNDGVPDAVDNCVFAANATQADVDADGVGDACDPLDATDRDGDGVPDGPMPGDPLYAAAQAAAAKWASASQHFVIRIDALGRWWQSEFTQTLADAAMAPDTATFQGQCAANYAAGSDTDAAYRPDCASMSGGWNLPVSLAVIPKMLWTDPTVVSWINDRNDSANLEIAQHGTYHVSNNGHGSWAGDPAREPIDCETCGLTEAENLELLRVGQDTLVGNYGNAWVAQSGATSTSPKIDWTSSVNPLVTYIAPYDTSDTTSRHAMAQLGYKGFSASWFEEAGGLAPIMSPEGSHMYAFDQFGMFHASAYRQVSPGANLQNLVDAEGGNLHVWLIEEVDWSSKGTDGAVNDKIDAAKWAQWNQLLDFVATYPGSVAMTIGEVALAKAFDNAPTVPNPDQADADHDGVGDVIEGAGLVAADASIGRNVDGTLSATLTNGVAQPLAGQTVTFAFDADGDTIDETYAATTDASGVAQVSVTATRPIGSASFSVAWDSLRGVTATDTGDVAVADAAVLHLDAGNPASGQVTDQVSVGTTLVDSDGNPIEGRAITFSIGSASATADTDALGHASATLTLAEPVGATTLGVSFAGDPAYSSASDVAPFMVEKEDTSLTLSDATGYRNSKAVATATLVEADGVPLAGRAVEFRVQDKVRKEVVWVSVGTAATDANGVATVVIPTKWVANTPRPIQAVFAGDGSYLGSSGEALAFRR